MFIKIDLERIKQNIKTIRGRLNPDVKFCAVVKADAYGHGIADVSQSIEPLVDFFGVARVGEGLLLRRRGIKKPILVLSPQGNDVKAAVAEGLSLVVSNIEQLDLIESCCRALGVTAALHIKIDTGMNRLGVKTFDDAEALCWRINSSSALNCEGVYSHLASTIHSDANFFEMQNKKFAHFADVIKIYFPNVIRHLANTSAALACGRVHYDMVRVGIGMYGYSDCSDISLLPAKSVYAKVLETKRLCAGETVGYDRAFTATEDMYVAAIDCGYGDGFSRNYAKNGKVLTETGFCAILGHVCMDISIIENVDNHLKKGNNVILLGENRKKCLWANDIFQNCGTIIYETLCNLRKRE